MRRTLCMMLAVLGVLLSAVSCWGAVTVTAHPTYQFDDVYGPSGVGAQWVAITGAVATSGSGTTTTGVGAGTVGGLVRDGMGTIANFVISRDHVYIDGENRYEGGNPEPDWPLMWNAGAHAPIESIFMVIPESAVGMDVSFGLKGSWTELITQDVLVDFSAYNTVVKTPISTVPYATWQLALSKTAGTGIYDTRGGNMIFQQNPSGAPSQTLQMPFIIANVVNGTAEQKPLLFRATMRERFPSTSGPTSRGGNIVAYDHFTWNVMNELEVGGTPADWVFVPVDVFPIDSNNVPYQLITEITNYSGTRYAMQRYDAMGIQRTPLYPLRWTMDLPADVTDISRNIALDELSHVAPGLITTYTQNFDVVSGRQNIFDMYPVDPAEGHRKLLLTHPQIFGQVLGDSAFGDDYNDYTVTGFKLWTSNTRFLENVASAMGVRGAAMPERSDSVMNAAVTQSFVTADAINTITIDAETPDHLVTSGDTAGVLPLHITLNLPRSNRFVLPKWNDFYTEWRATGKIKETFAKHFRVYMYDANENMIDLFSWLNANNVFDETVKVFMDENQSTVLSPEYGDCITISFIVMLMDGQEKTMRMVRDQTGVTDNSYLVMKDGNFDGRWNMTFFTAPIDYTLDGGQGGAYGSGDGGGGCSAGIPVLALLFVCGFTLVRKVG